MAEIKWNSDHTITVDPPKRPKKITGTRLASILGLNKWSTPFATWCEITKTYQEPFEDTIYTIAGKTIEPKQAEYARKYATNLITPTDVYGKDYFSKTYGDFFPDDSIFGGMWDYVDGTDMQHVDTVFEMKTTKRAEDWEEDIPEYYAIQAALYAYLLKCDQVVMVCSFLGEKDYDNPDAFTPDSNNTIIRSFKVSERYPNFEADYLHKARVWWNTHVVLGESPEYTERDADIIKELRKGVVEGNEDELRGLLNRAIELKAEIAKVADAEKELKNIEMKLKAFLAERLENAPNLNEMTCGYTDVPLAYTVSKSERKSFDTDAFSVDHADLYNEYVKTKTTYTMRAKEIK